MTTIDLSTLTAKPADENHDELTDEQREQLRAMGEEHGIKPEGRAAETAFLVVITPDGQVIAEPNIHTPLNPRRVAGFDDFQRAGHVLVDDALAIKTATIMGQQMMQMTAAMAEQQRSQAIARSLKL